MGTDKGMVLLAKPPQLTKEMEEMEERGCVTVDSGASARHSDWSKLLRVDKADGLKRGRTTGLAQAALTF